MIDKKSKIWKNMKIQRRGQENSNLSALRHQTLQLPAQVIPREIIS
jgi:hypothetical protein